MKICIVERISKAELRPKEQNKEAESCRVNLWHEVVERAMEIKIDTRTELKKIKKSGQARLLYVFDINHNIPTT